MRWGSPSVSRRQLEYSLGSTQRGRQPRSTQSRRYGSSRRPDFMPIMHTHFWRLLLVAVAAAIAGCSSGQAENGNVGRGGGRGRDGGAVAVVAIQTTTPVRIAIPRRVDLSGT